MATPLKSLEPMLRYAGFRPDLARFAPVSRERVLHTLRLSESPLVKGLNAEFADNCLLTVPEDALNAAEGLKLTLQGGKRRFEELHLAVLDPRAQLTVALADDQCKLVIGSGCVVRGHVLLSGRSRLFIGDNTTVAASRFYLSRVDVQIGDDAQVGEDCLFDTSEPGALTDRASGELLNTERRRIQLDRHVWLGRRVIVLPDAKIGAGTLVEPGSVVRGELPAQVMAGGSPATVLREGVDWARRR